jgi:hypothetical protein
VFDTVITHPKTRYNKGMNVSKLQSLSQAQAFAQIVAANIPRGILDRDKVVTETTAFVAQFQHISTHEVKELTRLRQENGNRDPELVPFARVTNADDLATNLEEKFNVGGVFVLKNGESLRGTQEPEVQGSTPSSTGLKPLIVDGGAIEL